MFHKGVFQWRSGRDDFLLELLYKPPSWREFDNDVSLGEPLNQKYNFGLDRFYIVEDPLEAVSVVAVVPVSAFFPYKGDFKISDVGRI